MCFFQVTISENAPKSSNSSNDESPRKDKAKEVAIQANDYDIERNSSNLPNRKRYIPLKFRSVFEKLNFYTLKLLKKQG